MILLEEILRLYPLESEHRSVTNRNLCYCNCE